jgi:23S rRNA pseudouridine955/2504/2580 synthase
MSRGPKRPPGKGWAKAKPDKARPGRARTETKPRAKRSEKVADADPRDPDARPRRRAMATDSPPRSRAAALRAKASDPAPAPVPAGPTRAEVKVATAQVLASGVQTLVVTEDEADMRVDRFLSSRFPQLPFSHIQRIVRKGELRIDSKRVDTKDHVQPGQKVRIPPLKAGSPDDRPAPRPPTAGVDSATRDYLASITLYEDADVLVLNKPAGLAVQGGSGTVRHVDGMLDALMDKDGQKPRLVHRLDKDTAGCLVIAKSRLAAATLAKTFRSRSARKIYWALVAGVPRVKQGRISTYLAREEAWDGDARMAVSKHGEDGSMHAVTYYAVVDQSAQKMAWLSLKPVTGRTHQLRAHAAHIKHPIIGDPKYFNIDNWEFPGGIQKKLHLLARRIVLPHPRGQGIIDVTAPLPAHMRQSWNLLGFQDADYDPIVDAPDE